MVHSAIGEPDNAWCSAARTGQYMVYIVQSEPVHGVVQPDQTVSTQCSATGTIFIYLKSNIEKRSIHYKYIMINHKLNINKYINIKNKYDMRLRKKYNYTM